jgi:hypothetical protein
MHRPAGAPCCRPQQPWWLLPCRAGTGSVCSLSVAVACRHPSSMSPETACAHWRDAICIRPQPALAENPQNSGAMTSTEGDKQLIDPATDADLQSKPRQKTSSGLEYQEVVAGKGPSPSVGIQVQQAACGVLRKPWHRADQSDAATSLLSRAPLSAVVNQAALCSMLLAQASSTDDSHPSCLVGGRELCRQDAKRQGVRQLAGEECALLHPCRQRCCHPGML